MRLERGIAVGLVAFASLACNGSSSERPTITPVSPPGISLQGGETPSLLVTPSQNEAPTPQLYSGEISGLKDKPLIDEGKFATIVEALAKSSHPLLQKISRDVQTLHATETNPSEFPSWVSEISTPLPVTYDYSQYSLASGKIIGNQDDAAKFHITTDRTIEGKELASLALGIHLGSPEYLRANGPLVEGLFLAKEHITHMLSLKMALEFYDVNEQLNLARVADMEGNPITDRERQIRVGSAIMMAQFGNRESNIWQLADGMPILILGSVLSDLVSKKELPDGMRGTSALGLAAIQLRSNPVLAREVNQMITKWLEEDTFLPPSGIMLKLATPPVGPAVYGLQAEIIRRLGPPVR